MSRRELVIGIAICMALVGAASAAPGMTITAHDLKSETAQRAATTALVTRELGAKLASTTCDGCHVDASIARLDVDTTTGGVTITANVNIAISDARGVVICVVLGGARASSTARGARLTALRDEALTAAVDGMSGKLAGALHHRHLDTWLATVLRTWFAREGATS